MYFAFFFECNFVRSKIEQLNKDYFHNIVNPIIIICIGLLFNSFDIIPQEKQKIYLSNEQKTVTFFRTGNDPALEICSFLNDEETDEPDENSSITTDNVLLNLNIVFAKVLYKYGNQKVCFIRPIHEIDLPPPSLHC